MLQGIETSDGLAGDTLWSGAFTGIATVSGELTESGHGGFSVNGEVDAACVDNAQCLERLVFCGWRGVGMVNSGGLTWS